LKKIKEYEHPEIMEYVDKKPVGILEKKERRNKQTGVYEGGE